MILMGDILAVCRYLSSKLSLMEAGLVAPSSELNGTANAVDLICGCCWASAITGNKAEEEELFVCAAPIIDCYLIPNLHQMWVLVRLTAFAIPTREGMRISPSARAVT